MIAIIAILAAILFPVFAKAREKARQIACLSNLKQIGLGYYAVQQDNDEQFPSGLGHSVTFTAMTAMAGQERFIPIRSPWASSTAQTIRQSRRRFGSPCSYAFNANLSQRPIGAYNNPPPSYVTISS